MGANVSIMDISPARLRYIHDVMGGHITTVMANPANIGEEVLQANIVDQHLPGLAPILGSYHPRHFHHIHESSGTSIAYLEASLQQ